MNETVTNLSVNTSNILAQEPAAPERYILDGASASVQKFDKSTAKLRKNRLPPIAATPNKRVGASSISQKSGGDTDRLRDEYQQYK